MRKTVYLDDFLARPLSRINLIDEYSTRNGFYSIYRLYVGYRYPGVAAGRPQGASAQLHPGSAEPQPTPQSKEAPPSLCDGENGAGGWENMKDCKEKRPKVRIRRMRRISQFFLHSPACSRMADRDAPVLYRVCTKRIQ